MEKILLELTTQSRKQKIKNDNDFLEFYKPYKKRKRDDENEDLEYGAILNSDFVSHLVSSKKRKPRAPNRVRNKEWWENCYRGWSGKDFKKDLRVTRATFNLILDVTAPYIFKGPTNLNPEPISVDRQLGLTLYRLGHGVSYSILSQLFGVSISLASETFNKVSRVLVAASYDQYVTLPKMDEKWGSEVKGFIENYELPCAGAWDGFHVYVSSKLKSFYSFKKRYSMSNLGLVGYNKRFLYCGVGAQESTHNSRMLRSTSLYEKIISGNIIPDKGITLADFGNIALVTIGDTAFPKHSWLLKGYNEDTRDPKQRHFNKKLSSACVVTENAYGMLKGRFRTLCKKTECRLKNLKYAIMACVMLHSLFISVRDPRLRRWRLQMRQLGLIRKACERKEDKNGSELNRLKISNWLWNN